VELRRPLGLLFALGVLGWPVGVFGFGGFDDDTGTTIVVAGCFLALGSVAAELLLRWRDQRRTTRSVGTSQGSTD
jgi:hypothetical protein